MPLVTTHATILKTYEYSETSKILRLLTRDHGLCSVIAKGARRPKSRFGGLLEPYTDGVATYYAKEGRELHTLSGFELLGERQALGNDLVRYAGAGILTEIALRFAPPLRIPSCTAVAPRTGPFGGRGGDFRSPSSRRRGSSSPPSASGLPWSGAPSAGRRLRWTRQRIST